MTAAAIVVGLGLAVLAAAATLRRRRRRPSARDAQDIYPLW